MSIYACVAGYTVVNENRPEVRAPGTVNGSVLQGGSLTSVDFADKQRAAMRSALQRLQVPSKEAVRRGIIMLLQDRTLDRDVA